MITNREEKCNVPLKTSVFNIPSLNTANLIWALFPVQVIFALNQTLLQQESLRAGSLQVPYTTDDLIKHYNCGDLNSIIFNHDTSQVGAPPPLPHTPPHAPLTLTLTLTIH